MIATKNISIIDINIKHNNEKSPIYLGLFFWLKKGACMTYYVTHLFFLSFIINSLYCGEKQTDVIKNIVIGAMSGAASMAVYAPWSYFQNRHIQQKPIEWHKPHHWWRGYRILACNNAPVIAIQQATYLHIKHIIQTSKKTDTLSHSEKTLAVTCAGGISGPINNTAQLIALQQQNNGLSIIQTINKMPEKYKSLHRASVPAIYRGMFFANSYMNCLPFIKSKVAHITHNNLVTLLISGFMSSLFITATSQPMQVIITTLHADIEKKQYNGMIDAVKKITKKQGIKALYHGSLYRTAGNTIALPVLEYVQKILHYL